VSVTIIHKKDKLVRSHLSNNLQGTSMNTLNIILISLSLFGLIYLVLKEFNRNSTWLSKRRYFTLYPFLGIVFFIPLMIVILLTVIFESPAILELARIYELPFYMDGEPQKPIEEGGSVFSHFSTRDKVIDSLVVVSYFVVEIVIGIKVYQILF